MVAALLPGAVKVPPPDVVGALPPGVAGAGALMVVVTSLPSAEPDMA